MIRYRRLLTLAVLAACHAPTDASPVDVRLLTSTFWGADQAVTIRSAAFGPDDFGRYSTVRVLLGAGSPLEVQRVDDSTVAAMLPDGATGTHDLTVTIGELTYPIGKVTIYGFSESFSLPVAALNDLFLWPRNGHAGVIASDPGLGLLLISADTRAVQIIPQAKNHLRGPGMTPRAGEFLLMPRSEDDSVEGWSVYPAVGLTSVHDMPSLGTRQAMQLSENGWLLTRHHDVELYRRTDSDSPWEVEFIRRVEESEGVYMSPRGDRATIRVDRAEGGAPIFDTRTATVAYRSPMLSSHGVDFSAAGSHLLLAGGRGSGVGPFRVVLLDATSGSEIAAQPLDREPFAATIDRSSGYAFVGVTDEEERPVVLVYDAETLEPVAELRVPEEAPACWCYRGVIATSWEPAIYVVTGGGSVQIYRFDMVPDFR